MAERQAPTRGGIGRGRESQSASRQGHGVSGPEHIHSPTPGGARVVLAGRERILTRFRAMVEATLEEVERDSGGSPPEKLIATGEFRCIVPLRVIRVKSGRKGDI